MINEFGGGNILRQWKYDEAAVQPEVIGLVYLVILLFLTATMMEIGKSSGQLKTSLILGLSGVKIRRKTVSKTILVCFDESTIEALGWHLL